MKAIKSYEFFLRNAMFCAFYVALVHYHFKKKQCKSLKPHTYSTIKNKNVKAYGIFMLLETINT